MDFRIAAAGIAAVLGMAAAAAPVLSVDFDRADAVYKTGEKAGFVISLTPEDGKPLPAGAQFEIACDQPGTPVQTLPAAAGKTQAEFTADRPGFVRVTVKLTGADPAAAAAVCAVDPEHNDTAQPPPPADFMTFWRTGLDAALALPLDAKLDRLDRISDAENDGYAISFANVGGTRMYGYIVVPKGPGPFPVVLNIPGAGPGSTDVAAGFPRGKAIAMTLNVHAYQVEPATAQARYDELNKPGAYMHSGIASRDTFYFRRTILGLCRGVKYLTERPDWDRKHFVVWGSSQGGAMTLAVTALNPDTVTAAAVNVPAMCGLDAHRNGTLVPGWPSNAERSEKYFASTLQYYDGANFARFIKCPMIFGVGLMDSTCPPWTVFEAYNHVGTEKMIWISPKMGHDLDPAYTAYREKWIARKLGTAVR